MLPLLLGFVGCSTNQTLPTPEACPAPPKVLLEQTPVPKPTVDTARQTGDYALKLRAALYSCNADKAVIK